MHILYAVQDIRTAMDEEEEEPGNPAVVLLLLLACSK